MRRLLWVMPFAASLGFAPSCTSSSAAVSARSNDGGPSDSGLDASGAAPLPSTVTFPKGFMWGTSTAAFQVEKGDVHTDWAHWVTTAGKIKNGDVPDIGGPDAFAHLDEDVGLMKSEGHSAYRFSIEWGRIYPTRAAFDADTPDPDAIAAYAALLAKLEAAGITPMVTLNHFALPDWLDDVTGATKVSAPQGWELP